MWKLTLLAPLLVTANAVCAENAREIVERSVSKDLINWDLARNYTFVANSLDREMDDKGNVKKTKSESYDILVLYGEPYERLTKRDGKPLPEKDEHKEQEKLSKLIAKREKESPGERQKRLAEFQSKRQKRRAYLREIPDAYDLKIAGEEKIAGMDTWVIDATPRPRYQAKETDAKYFKKIRGRIWITKADHQWVKLEAEVIDTISVGLVLFRLQRGSRLEFEQTRVNDEIWLPRREHVHASARMGLMLKGRLDSETTFENYRKFQSDSRLLSGAEQH